MAAPALAVAGGGGGAPPEPAESRCWLAAWTASGNLQMLTRDELDAAAWARTTPERSVFVTDGWLHAFTDPAGRLRLSTFGPYVANLGYDADARAAEVAEIYCGGVGGRAARR